MRPYSLWSSLDFSAVSSLGLALVIVVIIGVLLRVREKSHATWYLIGSLGVVLGITISRLLAVVAFWYWMRAAECLFVMLAWIPMFQFAYHVPHASPGERREARIVLVLSVLASIPGMWYLQSQPLSSPITESPPAARAVYVTWVGLGFFGVIRVLKIIPSLDLRICLGSLPWHSSIADHSVPAS